MARTLLANAKGSLLTFLRLFSIGWSFGKNPAGRQLQTILTLGESGAFGGLGIATGRVAGVLASSVRVLYEPLQLDGTRTFTMAGKSATSTPPTLFTRAADIPLLPPLRGADGIAAFKWCPGAPVQGQYASKTAPRIPRRSASIRPPQGPASNPSSQVVVHNSIHLRAATAYGKKQ
ncbi:hypothetical protein V8E36_007157 [Tilletia maclaganii]